MKNFKHSGKYHAIQSTFTFKIQHTYIHHTVPMTSVVSLSSLCRRSLLSSFTSFYQLDQVAHGRFDAVIEEKWGFLLKVNIIYWISSHLFLAIWEGMILWIPSPAMAPLTLHKLSLTHTFPHAHFRSNRADEIHIRKWSCEAFWLVIARKRTQFLFISFSPFYSV